MSASEQHLTLIQARTKRQFLAEVEQLEKLHQEPDELEGQLDAGHTMPVRNYLTKFDKQTSRVLYAFFRYMSAMERRPR